MGVAADVHVQDGDEAAGGRGPVVVQLAGGRIEEDIAGHVALAVRERVKVGVQSVGHPVAGQDVQTAAGDQGGDVAQGIQYPVQARSYSLRRRRPVLRAAGPGEGEQVAALDVVEAQGAGDGVQHRVGDVGVPAALEADVVVHAHPGQLRDLLAPQAWDPAAPGVGRQPGRLRGQPRAAGAQEVAQFGLALELRGGAPGWRLRAHAPSVGPARRALGRGAWQTPGTPD